MADFKHLENYILAKLDHELDMAYYYHNAGHTKDVVLAARQLSKLEKIKPGSARIIETAALFHDTGILVRYQDHEEESCRIAEEILPGYGYTSNDIEKIKSLILATKEPRNPVSPEEKILCDADMNILGREDFFISSLRLHLEWKLMGFLDATLRQWFKLQVEFLQDHRYYTGSANALWQEQKQMNLVMIRQLLENEL